MVGVEQVHEWRGEDVFDAEGEKLGRLHAIDVVWFPGSTDTSQPRVIHLHCNPTTRQPTGLA